MISRQAECLRKKILTFCITEKPITPEKGPSGYRESRFIKKNGVPHSLFDKIPGKTLCNDAECLWKKNTGMCKVCRAGISVKKAVRRTVMLKFL